MPYLVNVDLDVPGSAAGCRAHPYMGRHYDITIHTLTCGKARTPEPEKTRNPNRFWAEIAQYSDARGLAPRTKNGLRVLVRPCRLCRPSN
jgi:hypothetical protein